MMKIFEKSNFSTNRMHDFRILTRNFRVEKAFDDVNFGCEEGELDIRFSSIRCSELYSSKLLYEAIINAIQKATGYEGETKILADNPASMFQVAQTMIDSVQSPIFIILERGHEFLRHYTYYAITITSTYKISEIWC